MTALAVRERRSSPTTRNPDVGYVSRTRVYTYFDEEALDSADPFSEQEKTNKITVSEVTTTTTTTKDHNRFQIIL